MTKLYELAKVLRSKNSGPFEVTMDVLFDQKAVYERVKRSNAVTKESVAKAYNINLSDIHHFVFFDPALGIKITMAREISSGTAGDRDVYGAQQHAPLMNIDVDGE
ncbi:DUF4387 domain-containing protein [Robertmurraya kyonggiensis]|uniref:DUF4387 domain-containing protein n=1 Tax=Robertmurraya kyonggiensis TaxID=1037680 RepID=A0A4V5P4D0_9BACI|nr:DUF4387 domain-containing protein [Robertmurraya kyonggiensis]TKC16800.1 DUF4387 domain-containing protein [Robertmurraya kyonggiensis]